jgi:hypothetical protein
MKNILVNIFKFWSGWVANPGSFSSCHYLLVNYHLATADTHALVNLFERKLLEQKFLEQMFFEQTFLKQTFLEQTFLEQKFLEQIFDQITLDETLLNLSVSFFLLSQVSELSLKVTKFEIIGPGVNLIKLFEAAFNSVP